MEDHSKVVGFYIGKHDELEVRGSLVIMEFILSSAIRNEATKV